MSVNFLKYLFLSLLLHSIIFLPRIRFKKEKELIIFPLDIITFQEAEEKTQQEVKKEPEIIQKVVEKKKKEKKIVKEKKEQKQEITTSQININIPKFQFTYYLKIIKERVSSNWQETEEFLGQQKTTVYFRIYRDGNISPPKVEESSGNNLFDQLALRAVTLASPFPPLPSAYTESFLGVYFEFSFKE